MPTDEEFEAALDEVDRSLTSIGINFEREVGLEDEEEGVQAILFRFYTDVETDFYIGVRNDNEYIEVIWKFDLLPYIASQLNDDQAEEIIEEANISYDISEIPHDQTRALGRLVEGTEEEEIDQTIAESQIDLDEPDFDEIWSQYRRMYAAILALDSVSSENISRIDLRLEEVFINHPIGHNINTSDNNGLLGFKISHRLFPNSYGHSELSLSKIDEVNRKISNLGIYAEKFLKSTFSMEEEQRPIKEDNKRQQMVQTSPGPFDDPELPY